jgi:hypothetical protein
MFKPSKGMVSAALTILAMGLTWAGKGQLAAYVNDPATIDNLMLLIGSAGALISGALEGAKKKEVVNVEVPAVSRADAANSLSAGKA